MMKNVQKILVLGGPGSGKSVLSDNLGKQMNIPVFHLDDLHVECNVPANGKVERNNKILSILKQKSWIMDGNYRSTLQERIEKSDIIIFLDYPTYKLIWGVLSRAFKNISNINKGDLITVIQLALLFRKQKRADILKIINNANKHLIFNNRQELNKWFKREFNEVIRSV